MKGKILEMTKDVFNRVQHKTVDTINKVDHALAKKSKMVQKGVSNGKFIGTRRVTLETFRNGIFNIKKVGIVDLRTVITSKIQYTPAHKTFDIKMPHTFKIYAYYSKKEDRTHIFVLDVGLLDLTDLFSYADATGTEFVFDGFVSEKDFTDSRSFSIIATRIYDAKEKNYRYIAKEEAA